MDLQLADGELCFVATRLRKGYFGIAMSPRHAQLVERRVKLKLAWAMTKSDEYNLFNSRVAEAFKTVAAHAEEASPAKPVAKAKAKASPKPKVKVVVEANKYDDQAVTPTPKKAKATATKFVTPKKESGEEGEESDWTDLSGAE